MTSFETPSIAAYTSATLADGSRGTFPMCLISILKCDEVLHYAQLPGWLTTMSFRAVRGRAQPRCGLLHSAGVRSTLHDACTKPGQKRKLNMY